MDYITLALVGLLLLCLGFVAGSLYWLGRMNGKTRMQAIKALVGGGGGPNEP
jgi:uncharacterized protein YqgC (DUF456 family)